MILIGDGTGQYVDGTSEVIDGPVPAPKLAFRSVVEDFNGDDLPDFFSGNTGEDGCDDMGWPNTLMLTNQDGKLYDASANILGAPCTSLVPLYEGQAPCHLGGEFGGRPPGVHYPDITAPLTTLNRDFTIRRRLAISMATRTPIFTWVTFLTIMPRRPTFSSTTVRAVS